MMYFVHQDLSGYKNKEVLCSQDWFGNENQFSVCHSNSNTGLELGESH